MKKIFLKIGILVIIAMIILPVVAVLAADDLSYTVLAPLPGVEKTTTLETYIPAIFKLAIGLSAVAAILMIVIGGFQYISSDAIMKKLEGKERIKNAVFGLVLVISAWLILNTINPNLLNINLNIESISTATVDGGTLGGEASAGTGKTVAWYPLTEADVIKNNTMRKDLLDNYNVRVNAGPCTTVGQVTGCTNLVGMTPTTFKGVTDLKKYCSLCTVTISGGTEGGHASHGPNLPPIDLRPDTALDAYIKSKDNEKAPPRQTSLGIIYTVKVGPRNATFLDEGDHWHVVFE